MCFSLPNLSSDIRWSLDLRWQRSGDPDCFWGVKDPVVMRKKDDPGYKVDWTKFDEVSFKQRNVRATQLSAKMLGYNTRAATRANRGFRTGVSDQVRHEPGAVH